MRKINVEESIIHKFDSRYDLSNCVALLGEQGYFSDKEDFSDYAIGTLSEVRCQLKETKYPFIRSNDKEGVVDKYMFFISEDAAVFEEEPKEKNLRPFKNIDEFSLETGCEVLGEDFITIRNKNTQKVYVLLYTGYSDEEVHLGGYILTFADLLKNYEFLIDEWQPFGIEE